MESTTTGSAAAKSTHAAEDSRDPRRMRAVVHDRYGSPDLLELREIDRPVPADAQVLVRVRAAGLHVGDCFCVRGAPLPVRTVSGVFRPKTGIPGFDLAGDVVAVGKNVLRFRPGDAVFGTSHGTCAEFATAKPDQLAPKPDDLGFEEAAALPTSGLAALHALRDAARIRGGEEILVNGASGGVGTFAVQLAKTYGARVTGVCGPSNVELVRSLGADVVIDYSQSDFAALGPRFDVILDNVENRSLSDCRRALKPTGTLILNSGTGARGIAFLVRLLKPLVLSPFARQNLRRYLSVPNHDDLVALAEFVRSGAVKPIIGATYPLEETAAALRHIEGGHAHGKVVVTLA